MLIRIPFPLLMFCGCKHTNVIEVPICNAAFTISVPKDIRENSKQRILFGDDILCTKQFYNIDSTSYIDISIYKDTSKRSLDKFMNGQIDIPGGIVEQRMFYTHKGRAVVEIICLFKNTDDRKVALKLVKKIANSIRNIKVNH